ncbi:MAG: hypothetical protein ACXW4B_06075 [Micavibrio sp.]
MTKTSRKTFAAAALLSTALFTGNAAAETVELTACTKDGQTASVTTEIEGKVGKLRFAAVAQIAFTNAIRNVTGAQIIAAQQDIAQINDDAVMSAYMELQELVYGGLDEALKKEANGNHMSDDADFETLSPIRVGAPACQP